jgi:hypothetical protein
MGLLFYNLPIPVSYEKYDTQKSNENYANESRSCILPFPQTWILNSLIFLKLNFIKYAE